MTQAQIKLDNGYNPLDIAEMVVMDRDWTFDRLGEGDLLAEVNGVWCNYRVWFTWQEDSGGLTLSCALDTKFPERMLFRIHSLLAIVNQKLWLGHFDICEDDSAITFRHSLLMRDGVGTTAEHLQDLLDIAINECERFYPAFQSVVWGGKSPAEALQLAMFETIAEA